MKVCKLLLLKGKPNSGKTTVLKTVINKLSKRKGFSRVFMCKGACKRMRSPGIVFGKGDVTAAFQANGRIVVVVTFGDAPYDATKVLALLEKLSTLIGGKVDLLVAALRETRSGALEQSYRELFGNPEVFLKARTPGQRFVDADNLNPDDIETVKSICEVVDKIVTT